MTHSQQARRYRSAQLPRDVIFDVTGLIFGGWTWYKTAPTAKGAQRWSGLGLREQLLSPAPVSSSGRTASVTGRRAADTRRQPGTEAEPGSAGLGIVWAYVFLSSIIHIEGFILNMIPA